MGGEAAPGHPSLTPFQRTPAGHRHPSPAAPRSCWKRRFSSLKTSSRSGRTRMKAPPAPGADRWHLALAAPPGPAPRARSSSRGGDVDRDGDNLFCHLCSLCPEPGRGWGRGRGREGPRAGAAPALAGPPFLPGAFPLKKPEGAGPLKNSALKLLCLWSEEFPHLFFKFPGSAVSPRAAL